MSLSPKTTASTAAPLPTGITSLADLMKERHIIADLYTECTKFYSMLLKRASGNRDIPPHIYRDLESSYSSLVLWGQGYGVADGNLDDLSKRSKLLQSITLEPLIRISESLRNRLHPQLGSRMHKNDSYMKYTLFVLINEAKQRLRALQSGLRDLDGEDIVPCLETIILQDEDSLEDMVADIKTDTQCLIDLDSMYEYPVNDLKSQPTNRGEATSPSLDWRQKFVDIVDQLFPLAGRDIIQQLGWFLNGRIDMRQLEYNHSSKIALQTLIEEDIYDTLILYFNIWKLHNDIDSGCPLCCESVGDTDFFETHLPQHAEEIYLQTYHPGLNRTKEKTHINLNMTKTRPKKPLPKDPNQTIKDVKASTFTKYDSVPHDSTSEESEDEHESMSTPDFKLPIKKTFTIAKSSTNTKSRPPNFSCHLCNDHPEGFHREYELRRHLNIDHLIRKFWICVDISPDKSFLANCKFCTSGKKYDASHNAAAHLRRVHFNKQKSESGSGSKASDNIRDGGIGGGNHSPNDELKKWMEEREERVDADTDTGQSSQDEEPPRTILSSYTALVGQQSDMLKGEYSMKNYAKRDIETLCTRQAQIEEEIQKLDKDWAELRVDLYCAPVEIYADRDIGTKFAEEMRMEREVSEVTKDGARLKSKLNEFLSAPAGTHTESDIETTFTQQARIAEEIQRLVKDGAKLRAQLNEFDSASVQ